MINTININDIEYEVLDEIDCIYNETDSEFCKHYIVMEPNGDINEAYIREGRTYIAYPGQAERWYQLGTYSV